MKKTCLTFFRQCKKICDINWNMNTTRRRMKSFTSFSNGDKWEAWNHFSPSGVHSTTVSHVFWNRNTITYFFSNNSLILWCLVVHLFLNWLITSHCKLELMNSINLDSVWSGMVKSSRNECWSSMTESRNSWTSAIPSKISLTDPLTTDVVSVRSSYVGSSSVKMGTCWLLGHCNW